MYSVAAGAAAIRSGGFVMSSHLRDLGQADAERVEARHYGAAAPSAHPRGAGFRVLSRMARKRAEAGPAYSPRHRLECEPDSLPAVG
jgi:hypothetical protein